jgi:flagellar hook-associated protein 1 FlgK
MDSFGFVGTGTQIAQVKRYSDEFLNAQVRTPRRPTSGWTPTNQISQIDNLLADTTSGLSPALQDFFNGVQDADLEPGLGPSRQALLSNAERWRRASRA